MAYISYTAPGEPAAAEAKRMANILRIHGVHPEVTRLHMDLYRGLMFGPSPLSRVQREMIAVFVSAINHCRY